MATGPVWENLPAAHCRAIGRIISKWAQVESHLRMMINLSLGISIKEGRIAVRKNRPVEQIKMVEDIFRLRKQTAPKSLSKAKSGINTLKSERDEIAHGLWIRVAGNAVPHLQLTSGSWDDQNMAERSRKISPQAAPRSVTQLNALLARIEAKLIDVERAHGDVSDSLSPLSDKQTSLLI